MRRLTMAAAAALLLATAPGRAEDTAMRRALDELKVAKQHLQAADHDYAGHRTQALLHIDRAIDEVTQGKAVSERREKTQAGVERKPEDATQKKEQPDD